MATCKECLHVDVCTKYGATVDFDVDDGVCLHFEKELVRCKDCKHYDGQDCYHPRSDIGEVLDIDPTDFCSHGERKDTTD